jgi:lysophospholipase L1-like esterase
MTPLKTFLSILSLFVVLGLMAWLYPASGITIADTTFRFPALTDIFEKKDPAKVEENTDVAVETDPQKAIEEMMAATQAKEFAEFSDSLKFYEDFFKEGRTRFDLPGDDPTWFDRFFLHLELAKIDSNVVHIMHYGDSQLEEDRISSTIREDLQKEFGGGGPGMLPAVLNIPSQSTSVWNNGDLTRFLLFGPEEDHADHNRYGPLAQVSKLEGSAVIGIKKRENKKDDFPHVGGYSNIKVLASKRGSLKVRLAYETTVIENEGTDKEKRKKKFVDAPAPNDEKFEKLRVFSWKLPDTTSNAKIYLGGNAEIYAISVDGPYGVAVDNVAMRGSSGTVFHRMDQKLLAESYKVMNARLIIMEYGGNLVPSLNKNNVEYTKKLIARQIQTIQKANPDADIVFIGPADMAKQIDGKIKSYPGLKLTIETLREVALENGAAYWDMYRVMGGEGSMRSWVKQSPPLAGADYIHFSRKGAAYMGELFCNALRMHYDYFKFRDKHKIDDAKLKDLHGYADSLDKAKEAAIAAQPVDTTTIEEQVDSKAEAK